MEQSLEVQGLKYEEVPEIKGKNKKMKEQEMMI
eukprot:CAMPEP_0170554918 /NCGR_PEP_ID=MMETSP0211-20121228/12793_1 /TAXON_ID=311385 /ORGANISM="Pseudokeronopsis sp., Strain OXSARD2" /LENGTH=32 /DNA_ID= /DNA_START= /DNA_END= /DNA_ORIENTATION=